MTPRVPPFALRLRFLRCSGIVTCDLKLHGPVRGAEGTGTVGTDAELTVSSDDFEPRFESGEGGSPEVALALRSRVNWGIGGSSGTTFLI